MKSKGWQVMGLVAAVLLLAGLAGCGSVLKDRKVEERGAPPSAQAPVAPAPMAAAPAPTSPQVTARADGTSRYVEFEDVRVPLELEFNRKKSYIFNTPGFKAGVLFFSGYVDPTSLTQFFAENMAKDNWSLKGSFKFPQVVLLFQKKYKFCLINIREATFGTDVEVWVAPTLDEK
jgi:hypothetical protein